MVLIDWRMQEQNGMEVLQIKREGSMNSMRVVILLSAPDERQFLEECPWRFPRMRIRAR